MSKSIIRTDRAGVFFAEVAGRNGDEATLKDARRIHYWNGASECIQLAMDGIGKPKESRVTMAVPEITVLGVIEVIPCSEKAEANLDAVPVWKA